MVFNEEYVVFFSKNISIRTPLRELYDYFDPKSESPKIWSARLSTGVLGLPDCKIGNLGPKGLHEVILGVGNDGLKALIDFGFITCPACEPEKNYSFWDAIKNNVEKKYCINTLEGFVDKSLLGFDSRRVDWETLFHRVNGTPNRLYVPPGLDNQELRDIQGRFRKMRLALPAVGYYDEKAEEYFTPYGMP